jgi:hypothetical protein
MIHLTNKEARKLAAHEDGLKRLIKEQDRDIEELLDAVDLLLKDYRSEGCADPDCLVCSASCKAKAEARRLLQKHDGRRIKKKRSR